jgi:uncharacterized protein YndB with AHSA1/START domain
MTNAKSMSSATAPLVVKRTIKAPRHQVYEAWLKPELRQQWWRALDNSQCTICEIDPKVGGHYRLNMKNPEKEYIFHGEFLELIDGEKIVFTWNVPGDTPEIANNRVTVELHEVPGGTEVVLTHEGTPNEQKREDHNRGWTACLELLAQTLEK